MKADLDLLRELEVLSTGDTIHLRLNLVGAYLSAIEQLNHSRDPDFQSLASEAHEALRILLTKLRWRRASERDGAH